MIDTTILREATRRIERKFAAVPRAYCACCDQNPGWQIDRVLETMGAIARHAESVTEPEWYAGIYVAQTPDAAVAGKD